MHYICAWGLNTYPPRPRPPDTHTLADHPSPLVHAAGPTATCPVHWVGQAKYLGLHRSVPQGGHGDTKSYMSLPTPREALRGAEILNHGPHDMHRAVALA